MKTQPNPLWSRRTARTPTALFVTFLLVVLAGCGPDVHGSQVVQGAEVALTRAVQAQVTPERLGREVDAIVRHERLSGSAGENAAIDHIVSVLNEDGVPVTVDTFMAFVSDPVSARVEVLGSGLAPEAITIAGSGSVSGLEGAVVDLGSTDALPDFLTETGENLVLEGRGPSGSGPAAAYPDLRGKIALVTGRPGPDEVTKVDALGAAGAVFVNRGERLNALTTTTVWGAPSLRDYHRVPTLPVAEVRWSGGEAVRELLARGPVRIRMSTETRAGWKPLRLAVARIPGPTPDAPYVVFGGHIDAWWHGATDEGASNAAMLELARAFNRNRDLMRRGLVVAWWPGHSNGRYAGSTWFVDQGFDDLRRNGVAYVNVDGIGQQGAQRFGASATASLSELARAVLEEEVGESVRAGTPGRNSDQSFNGVGLPLLQISHSRLAEDGGYWWWHTTDDTRDKVDLEVLKTDTDLYAAALSRLLAATHLPVDLAAPVERLGALLTERAEVGGAAALDLDEVIRRQQVLLELVREVDASLPPGGDPEVDLARVEILRPVHRVLYTLLGPYHPDPATDQGELPGLKPVAMLASNATDTDRYRFAETTLLRERARLLEALDRATAAAERLRDELQGP